MIPKCKILLNSVSQYDTLNLNLPTVQEQSIREETWIKETSYWHHEGC